MKLKQKLAIAYIRARLNILALVSARSAAEKAFALFCTPMKRSGKKQPPLFDQGEKCSFKLEGSTIRGHRWLPHQASTSTLKKVLIVHGFESSSRNFEQYIQAFLKTGYEVIAFDAPAHGQSGGRRITLPLYIGMLAIVTKKFGPIDAYVTHSFGGLALTLLLESQQSASAAKAPGISDIDLPQASEVLDVIPSQASGIPNIIQPRPSADPRLVLIAPACETTRAVDSLFELLHLNDEVRREFDALGHAIEGRSFDWYSVRRAMHQLTICTLWLQDEDDKVTPLEDALRVKEDHHPNIQFIITKGLGHRKIYRDPEVLRQIVAFLQ